MRNTLPLLSRAPAPSSSIPHPSSSISPADITPQDLVPTIRLISATPSAAGSAGDASMSFASSSYATIAPFASSPLAPKADANAPKKRLVPKKSKLGLLGGGKSKEKANKDFSDIARRVGSAPSTGRGGFEIYVDQNDDPELAEIVVVKKKKSRLALDGMKWGTLGEVTNVPSAPKEQKPAPSDNLLKVKGDENQKWWSIGRGRKDSKGKEKEQKPPARSKTPEPSRPLEGRARFNSLDSGILLNSPVAQPQKQGTTSSIKSLLEVPVIATAPLDNQSKDSLNVPTNGLLSPDAQPSGSIAVRAIRSMRSLARMASWAQLSNEKEGNAGVAATDAVKTKTKEEKKTTKEKDEKKNKEKADTMKKKKKKDKEKTKVKDLGSKEKEKTIRYSGSSFEAGALSAQGSPAPLKTEDGARTLSRKKQSVLGLGLPSTLRLATVRDVSNSTTGSATGVPQAPPRLSVDSAHLILNAQGRPSSILSSGSSLRPPSTASGISTFSGRSPRSSSSSIASVRWDEVNIRTAKETQRKERRTRREKEKEGGKTTRESRRSSESRRRTPISEIFPETQMRAQEGQQREPSLSPPASGMNHPIVRVEEATADGHSPPSDDEMEAAALPGETSVSETPIKRARPRPMSEQMLGRPRPQPICDDAEGDAVLSILDAATNDLASLINRLDLEATPASTNNTPLCLSPLKGGEESPLKARTMRGSPLQSELRESTASIASLRTYVNMKSQSTATLPLQSPKPSPRSRPPKIQPNTLVGQQIAPWSELDWKVSPRKPLVKPKAASHLKHERTLTPSPSDPMPVFKPLRPAKLKTSKATLSASPSLHTLTPPVGPADEAGPSSHTFGRRPSKVGLDMDNLEKSEAAPSPTPVFKKIGGHHRKSSSLIPMNSKGSVGSLRRMGVPISAEARKGLGLCGTLGGSTEPDVDPEDQDSDIPDELQVILSGQSDDDMTGPLNDTLSFRPPSLPGSPPQTVLPLSSDNDRAVAESEADADPPVFQAQLFDAEANQAELDEGEGGHGSASEDDTKKSFDFTGELQKLNESGASDRASFVEQLENAFKTPARIELGFDFGIEEGMLAPPVPAMPKDLNVRPTPPAEDVPRSFSNTGDTMSIFGSSEVHEDGGSRDSGLSQEHEHDISFMMRELEDECRVYPELARTSSMRSKPSDGRLNKDFKFGGRPSPQASSKDASPRPLTLSDIIPPLSHSHSRSRSQSSTTEDDSVLKSIMAKATDIMPGEEDERHEEKAELDTKLPEQSAFPGDMTRSSHARTESGLSFTGFDSFDEVRRGFEFGPNRPAFWPPPQAVFRPAHKQHESLYSIASISSYGAVVNPGAQDPFGYAHEPSRPPSMDDMSLSMSMSVDDTFSFIHRNKPRKRVDSDASSFYFRPAGAAQTMHPYRRGHRRGPSALSIASNAPPVSLYNRSFAGHRRNDSNTSASSIALSYAMHGAGGGRPNWAQHSRDYSVDSIMSDYSERPMARPGLGDKMFETSHGAPLSAIAASPDSAYSMSDREANRTSWDSIMDNENERYASAEDSLFDKTRNRNSVSSESVFGFDPYAQYTRPPPSHQFRPLSMMSEMSVHSPPKEDDTMITMLGGGHVRRLSVSSLVEASPCVRVERNKHATLPGRVLQFDMERAAEDSPNKSRLIEKPSIASTSSYQFGGERMIKARQGLLERQSLEESALMAHGEDVLASLRERSIFNKPSPAARSRSSTCTSSSSGTETPPLSSSDGSSISGGSQSSIDLGHLNTILANATHPSSSIARTRTRARARGMGHRRRIEQARMSRSSVYETIQEEASVLSSSPSPKQPTPQSVAKAFASPLANDSVYIVGDGESAYSDWDEERGIMTLRHYYALRDEAHETVEESKRVWVDTPFSIFAVQSFQPPREPAVMQAMLEHSKKNFGPLPSELRPHRVRSRTSSRASPYPTRSMRSSFSPEKPRSSPIQIFTDAPSKPFAATLQEAPVLREVQRDANTFMASPAPALDEIKPFSPLHFEIDTSKRGKAAFGLPPRPRVTSSTRRAALGWSKRSTGKSSTQDCKENISSSMIIPTPSETLRINRPRPRGRPTPARVAVPAA
ncbi:hypothetical protein BN946_scf184942.g10 [Trametes cinnabarina]|uniref:Uncharacterized protein n=1 Tax=Pycnoporus cinnabarinus TaxID=5643 RepID=A0A060S760_PYCCI|nr:hypothetical protein BN946_scf184942.g10 [Trametes cinnabarina]